MKYPERCFSPLVVGAPEVISADDLRRIDVATIREPAPEVHDWRAYASAIHHRASPPLQTVSVKSKRNDIRSSLRANALWPNARSMGSTAPKSGRAPLSTFGGWRHRHNVVVVADIGNDPRHLPLACARPQLGRRAPTSRGARYARSPHHECDPERRAPVETLPRGPVFTRSPGASTAGVPPLRRTRPVQRTGPGGTGTGEPGRHDSRRVRGWSCRARTGTVSSVPTCALRPDAGASSHTKLKGRLSPATTAAFPSP